MGGLTDDQIADGCLDNYCTITKYASKKSGDAKTDALDFAQRQVDDGFFEEVFLGDLADALGGDDINRKVPDDVVIRKNEEADSSSDDGREKHAGMSRPNEKWDEADREED